MLNIIIPTLKVVQNILKQFTYAGTDICNQDTQDLPCFETFCALIQHLASRTFILFPCGYSIFNVLAAH